MSAKKTKTKTTAKKKPRKVHSLDLTTRGVKQAISFCVKVDNSRYKETQQIVIGILEEETDSYIKVLNLGRSYQLGRSQFNTYKKKNIISGPVKLNF